MTPYPLERMLANSKALAEEIEEQNCFLPSAHQAADRSGTSKTCLYLWQILLVALAARLLLSAFILAQHPWGRFFNIQSELGTLAESLRNGHGLSSPFGGSTGPTAFLAPGYPALIGLLFLLLGSFSQASASALLLVQTLFGVATVFFIMRVAERIFGARTANAAGCFWAIGVPFVWLPAVFWDTGLSALFMIGLLALALRCEQQPTTKNWMLAGIFAAVALLVNPALLLTILAVFGWAAFRARGRSLTGPLLGLTVTVLLFAPWPARNAHVLHAFIPLRSNLAFELWKGNQPGANGEDDASLYPVFNNAEFNAYATEGEVAYMHRKGAEARAYISSHPAEFVRLCGLRFLRFWTGMGAREGPLLVLTHVSLLTLLAAFGFVCLLRRGRTDVIVLFALPLALFPLPYYVTHAELRFQIVVEPVTVLLAAYAVVCGWEHLRHLKPMHRKVSSTSLLFFQRSKRTQYTST